MSGQKIANLPMEGKEEGGFVLSTFHRPPSRFHRVVPSEQRERERERERIFVQMKFDRFQKKKEEFYSPSRFSIPRPLPGSEKSYQ
jgi:hypothetical protein